MFLWAASTIRQVIDQTSIALFEVLQPMYMPIPNMEMYRKVAERFWILYQLPNVVGDIDGKHIRMVKPSNSGSLYMNYKGYFSIVLMGTCDADCVFTMADVGAYGSQSDGGIVRNSHFGRRLLNGYLPIPPPKPLPNSELVLPHYFMGDAAFPLHKNIMRPYPGSNLDPHKDHANYRFSRARIQIERAFGNLPYIKYYPIHNFNSIFQAF